MYLQSDNLIIRNATDNDAEILCQWWNDGAVMAHAGFPNGLGTTVEKIKSQLSKDNDLTHRRLILEAYHQPIGEMNYRKVGEGVAQIGIKICDFSKQEKGLGTQYLKMLINFLFNQLHFEKIILDTNFNNKRAQHVYEKIGFIKVGERIDSWKNQLGELQSQIDYELTQNDFIKLEEH